MHTSFTPSNAAEHSFDHYPTTINGTEATHELARHQASIRLTIKDRIFGEGHICGGAVIAPSVVLTVGQCVHNYQTQTKRHPAELKIVMGTLNRYQRNENTLVYGVTHVYQPRTFNAQTLHDNIAILMLERDIPHSHPTVQPITLSLTKLRSAKGQEMFGDVGSFVVTSWLATDEHIPYTQLITLNATQLNDRECMQKYGSHYGTDMLCLGYKDTQQTAACEQDNGAPLIHNNVLHALSASQNVDCKTSPTNPVTFVDVGHHAEWILSQIGDGTNCNSSVWGTLAFLIFTILTARRTKWHKFWI